MRGGLLLACLLHTAVCPHANAAARTGGADTLATYRHLRDSAAAFHGPAISSSDTGILLGVLAPLSHVVGRECRLLHLSDDQTWHSTAHQLTRLIREDGAAALIGGLDGARAYGRTGRGEVVDASGVSGVSDRGGSLSRCP
jgi:hypothetical protein